MVVTSVEYNMSPLVTSVITEICSGTLQTLKGHGKEVNDLSVHPQHPHLVISGSKVRIFTIILLYYTCSVILFYTARRYFCSWRIKGGLQGIFILLAGLLMMSFYASKGWAPGQPQNCCGRWFLTLYGWQQSAEFTWFRADILIDPKWRDKLKISDIFWNDSDVCLAGSEHSVVEHWCGLLCAAGEGPWRPPGWSLFTGEQLSTYYYQYYITYELCWNSWYH